MDRFVCFPFLSVIHCPSYGYCHVGNGTQLSSSLTHYVVPDCQVSCAARREQLALILFSLSFAEQDLCNVVRQQTNLLSDAMLKIISGYKAVPGNIRECRNSRSDFLSNCCQFCKCTVLIYTAHTDEFIPFSKNQDFILAFPEIYCRSPLELQNLNHLQLFNLN